MITLKSSNNKEFELQIHSRSAPHVWDLPPDSENKPIKCQLKEDSLTSQMRLNLNLVFKNTTRKVQAYIDLNCNMKHNVRKLKCFLRDYFPVNIQLFHNSVNISESNNFFPKQNRIQG